MARIKRFFIEAGIRDKGVLQVRGNELHHMVHVLRLQVGETVEIFDGTGKAYLAEISSIQREHADLSIKEPLMRSSESSLSITLLQSTLKADKMDWIIQKTTELGVSEIQPVVSRRSILSREVVEKKIKRWQRIAREAAKQSGRLQSPRILTALDFSNIAELKKNDFGILLHRAEFSKTLGRVRDQIGTKNVLIAVGPEGGWDPQEVTLGRERGFVPVSIGPRTLRSETSGIIILALIQFMAGDMDQ